RARLRAARAGRRLQAGVRVDHRRRMARSQGRPARTDRRREEEGHDRQAHRPGGRSGRQASRKRTPADRAEAEEVMAGARTLHVRCTTWEQVEVFHTRKLRRGKLLSMRVPFRADPGSEVTLNLELPNQVTIAIDGVVLKSSPVEADPKAPRSDAGKTWLEVELVGFTEDVVARIRRMAAGEAAEPEAPPPPPRTRTTGQLSAMSGDELPADERALFQQLSLDLRRLR